MKTCIKIIPVLLGLLPVVGQAQTLTNNAFRRPGPAVVEADHLHMMELLHISSLRPGRNGSSRATNNAANYDETKANPFPALPDPLVLKNGQKVTSPDQWWNQRRP